MIADRLIERRQVCRLPIASGISKISIEEISLKALPFAFGNTLAVFVIAFVPEISLWLPRFFGY